MLLCGEQAVLKIVSGMFFFSLLFLIQESDLKMSSSVKVCLGSWVTLAER